ncbi:hypothetical protein H920_16117 [Fukomys damarensis]|uniref:Uncharacterized protein n=1 Tax=Fukomys damarensis TaxID=885580 RepID=A0A091DHZ2_FUKDA|nr:hypothetical protein H920_16117 [Fukomys damarensis]
MPVEVQAWAFGKGASAHSQFGRTVKSPEALLAHDYRATPLPPVLHVLPPPTLQPHFCVSCALQTRDREGWWRVVRPLLGRVPGWVPVTSVAPRALLRSIG